MSFASKLKGLMEELDLTQAKVSDLTGIGRSSISQYVSGKNEPSKERRERAKRMNELQCMMNNKVRDLQETALFEMLASKDPELKAMLDEYKTLRGC